MWEMLLAAHFLRHSISQHLSRQLKAGTLSLALLCCMSDCRKPIRYAAVLLLQCLPPCWYSVSNTCCQFLECR